MPGLCIIPERALADRECRGPRMTALLAIGTFTSRDGGGVWAANETLAEKALMSEREFRRAASWLVERGYVRKRVRFKASGAQDTNLLQIVLDDPEEQLAMPALGGGAESPTPLGGEGASAPPREGAAAPPPLGLTAPPRGGGESPTKRTHLNDPSDRPHATAAAGARPRGLAQQLAAAANRAFDERFGTNRNPLLSGTAANLLEAVTQHAMPPEWAVQAIYEAALKCDREPRSLHYFTAGLIERWAREQARDDAATFAPRVVGSVRPGVGSGRTREIAGGPPAHFWALCVEAGLTSSMQSRETIGERVQALQRDGRVADAGAFLALVLHVKPWALAEIKFAKTREERLVEALASFPAPAQGAA